MSDWQLVYEVDAVGGVVFGSVAKLSTAARRAADIKVMYSPGGGNWWSRYCPSVNIRGSGRTTQIAATYMVAADTTGVAHGIDFETPFAIEYHIYNSSGHRSVVKLDAATGQATETIADRVPMKWYAKDYSQSIWDIIIGGLFGGASGASGGS